MKTRTRTALRCSCRQHQLLAYYGLTEDGDLYLHVKAYKRNQVLANVVIYGDCELQCPSCFIWHTIRFRPHGRMDRARSLDPPAEIAEIEMVAPANSR